MVEKESENSNLHESRSIEISEYFLHLSFSEFLNIHLCRTSFVFFDRIFLDQQTRQTKFQRFQFVHGCEPKNIDVTKVTKTEVTIRSF